MSRGYFDTFQGFDLDPQKSLVEEFQRLALDRQWKKEGKTYRRERQKCWAQEFGLYFHQGKRTLTGWQDLCRDVSIEPVPHSITTCKKALSKTYVNLVDLIELRRRGVHPKLFPSKEALRRYSEKEGKIFSKKWAKDDGYLAALLITMF